VFRPTSIKLERILNASEGGLAGDPDETVYQGPVVVTGVEIGGRAIRIVRPADPDRLLDDPAVLDWNRRDDYMPYWAYLWPGAYLLAETVMREPWPAKKVSGTFLRPDTLEIGCGLGLAGLAALACGRTVLFTDYDHAPLDFVARSVAENAFDPARFAVRRLDWRDLPHEQFPVILGADVIYERPLVPLVANLLAKLLAPGGLGLIATPYRVAAEAFPSAVTAAGLACEAEPVQSSQGTGRSIEGTVYRVTWEI
jgi:predicted nicotinamide N-methyase